MFSHQDLDPDPESRDEDPARSVDYWPAGSDTFSIGSGSLPVITEESTNSSLNLWYKIECYAYLPRIFF